MSRGGRFCAVASLLAVLHGCAGEDDGGEASSQLMELMRTPESLDVRRSLAVTDADILARFPLQRVMGQLARDARIKHLSGLELFRQWWDTQNPAKGHGRGPHCDDEQTPDGKPLLNGFPYDCRPEPDSEGAQASCKSFSDPACAYIPIGLFNRFDLAPKDGANCGEHRIIYAKQTGQTNARDRNLVIFEAVLPNPFPWLGLQGCRRLIEAWAELSFIDSLDRRADRLEDMYFEGVWPFPPIVRFSHFGDNTRDFGQIRTNQFMIPVPPNIWTLREFKLYKQCERRGCSAIFEPVTAKNNPPGVLWGDPAADPRVRDFQLHMLAANVASLAATSLTDIAMSTPDEFNSGQSHSSGSPEMDYAAPLMTQTDGFERELWEALGALGSKVTPEQLARRAQTQTCAGCHQLSNNAELGDGLVWPASLRFVHVSEVDPEQGDDGPRFRISPLLTSSFLPMRARVMFDFLKTRPWRRRGWGWSVGGRVTH